MDKINFQLSEFLNQWGAHLLLQAYDEITPSDRLIHHDEIARPTLALCGYLNGFSFQSILFFDENDTSYCLSLDASTRAKRLSAIVNHQTPCVIVASSKPCEELIHLCRQAHVPIFISSLKAQSLLARLIFALKESFAPSCELHATLVNIFGLGVLLQGKAGIGKSETALGLIEKGHRLIGDDLVQIKIREGNLIGQSLALTRHHLEIKGLGIINIAHLHGMASVQESCNVDLIVELTEGDFKYEYDCLGLEWRMKELLGINISHHVLPVKRGRDLVLLIETLVRNHRLRAMGYHGADVLAKRLQKQMKKY